MAQISIPTPDAAGYFHWTYVVYDVDGRWYGGKRSSKRHPTSDPYLGSGKWVRSHPDRKRLRREIVAFYATSKEVYAAEARMITFTVISNDPLCMNQRDGGDGMTVEYARIRAADPNWQPIKLRAIAKRSANPKWRKTNAAANRRRAADPVLRESQANGCRKRSADPVWLTNNTASARRLAKDPAWQEAHAAGLRRAMADPAWPAAHAAAMVKRNANLVWRAKVAATGAAQLRRMAAEPGWREAHIAKNKRMAKDPVWQEAVAVGLAKRNANPVWRASVVARNRDAATIFVTLNGSRLSLYDACRAVGISYQTAYARRAKGLPESEWLSPPRKQRAAR
jgi:hypothetical protein